MYEPFNVKLMKDSADHRERSKYAQVSNVMPSAAIKSFRIKNVGKSESKKVANASLNQQRICCCNSPGAKSSAMNDDTCQLPVVMFMFS